MAMASYFFVGSADEAKRNDGLEEGPADRRAEFYRVHGTALKPLHEQLTGQACPSFEPAAMSEDYDQLTFIFPESLVKALANVEAHDMTAVIETWKETSEVPYDNDQDLQDLLAALCRLSKLALEREEDLYLWNCL
ncbi:hypothetical protein [Gimesia chilikensis]|uniref:Uncharacterized protein n=1 Tax=Gimesia chilikensis TaxID=2605989 RepID=A0A517PS98_9PLAN|nr:hypothetical protein [Gimesia chilikensis]QDT22250.1 hypothetical protein HG66A1_40570 [Gimesia chilikensis]